MIGESSIKDHRDEYFKEMRQDLKELVKTVGEIKLEMKDIRLDMKDLVHEDSFAAYREANQNRAGKSEQRLQNIETQMITEEKLNKSMENYLEKPSVQTILAERIDSKKRQGRRNLLEDWSFLQKLLAILGSLIVASGFSFYVGKGNQEFINKSSLQAKFVEREK